MSNRPGDASVLRAESVPGNLSSTDKEKVAEVFNILKNSDVGSLASPGSSRLRVVDTLPDRFKFVILNPRNVSLAALQTARLKLGKPRELVLDLNGGKFVADCWRSGKADTNRGVKRGRATEPLEALPSYIAEPLKEATSGEEENDLAFLQKFMGWILNNEDFCVFEFEIKKEEGSDIYKITLGQFDPVTSRFVAEMENKWGAFLRDAIFDFSSRSLILYVAK